MDHSPRDAAPLMSHTDRTAREADEVRREWSVPRFAGIERRYEAEEVVRLRGSVRIEHSLARQGSARLWELLHERPYINALGAMTGGQAVQMVRAGLEAIYLSGWQVAADANLGEQVYPDQSLYPANSVPRSCGGSRTRCAAPTRSSGPRAAATGTGWRRSSPTPRPASAAR